MRLTKTDRQKLRRIMEELSLFADWARFGLWQFRHSEGKTRQGQDHFFANACCRGVVGVARSGGMAERFNAPVLKTEMVPRRIVASLVYPRTEPNETEALRIKKRQQTGNIF